MTAFDARPGHPARLGCILWIFAVIAMVFYLIGTDELALHGVSKYVKTPQVHRFWEGKGAPAVPASRWTALGFVVYDHNNSSASMIIGRHNRRLLDVYNRLPNWAARADLFRYVVLYVEGGWWADADLEPTKDLAVLAAVNQLVFFHEACGRVVVNKMKRAFGLTSISRETQLKNAIFAAKRGWPPLLSVINIVQRREGARVGPYTEAEVVSVTGPGALTDGVYVHLIDAGATLVRCSDAHIYFNHLGLGLWRGRALNTLSAPPVLSSRFESKPASFS